MSIEVGGIDIGSLQKAGVVPTLVRGAITYAAGTTGAVGATTLFTVTGDVLVTSIAAKCTTGLTSGGAPTWDLGVVGNTDFIVTAQGSVTTWTAGKWYDFSASGYFTGGAAILTAIGGVATFGTSANIIQTIATATITGGVVRWYLQYVPLSSDGAVALHSNLVAF